MKVHAVFNTDQLGGAERSFINSLAELPEYVKVTVWIPKLKDPEKLEQIILSLLPHARVMKFKLNGFYYQSSRSSKFFKPLLILSFIFALWRVKSFPVKSVDILWLNGNKVGALFTALCIMKSWKGSIWWHLRDYFPKSTLLERLINRKSTFEKHFIANSFSVRDDFKIQYPSQKNLHVLYNSPSEVAANASKTKAFRGSIGIASMLTPWKGQHDVLWMAYRQEDKLVELGVKEIILYGEDIYLTNRQDRNYKSSLLKISAQFSKIKVVFAGFNPLSDIYSSLDILIHSSIKPEPFGRVIVEAMSYGVPVLSTGLGGAGELVNDERAFCYEPAHDHMFVEALELAILDISKPSRRLNAVDFVNELHQQIKKQLSELIANYIL